MIKKNLKNCKLYFIFEADTMNDFELYNTIINNPIYLSITTLLAVLVIYSAIKKFIKWLFFALLCFIVYLSFLYYTGDVETVNDVDNIIHSVKEEGKVFMKEKIEDAINEKK